jgi:hypothetical protein
MTDAAPTAPAPTAQAAKPAPLSSAERMRLYRDRQKRHLRCVMVQMREQEIDALIRRWNLSQEDRKDAVAIRQALYRFFDQVLK